MGVRSVVRKTPTESRSGRGSHLLHAKNGMSKRPTPMMQAWEPLWLPLSSVLVGGSSLLSFGDGSTVTVVTSGDAISVTVTTYVSPPASVIAVVIAVASVAGSHSFTESTRVAPTVADATLISYVTITTDESCSFLASNLLALPTDNVTSTAEVGTLAISAMAVCTPSLALGSATKAAGSSTSKVAVPVTTVSSFGGVVGVGEGEGEGEGG
mmetsp:Transcript_101976/g.181137  ORF Transcript_101976/g.181137 Transcript_101976/m.181137 type:complete len:211 (+) Transcript_101976:114-746(+)